MAHNKHARRRKFALGILLTLVGLTWVAWAGMWSWLREAVDRPRQALHDDWFSSRRILDRERRLLRELPTEHGRRGRPVSLGTIGPRLVQATLTSEDARFYEHDGVDGQAITRALGQNLRHGRLVSGASTITQQLVKLVDGRGVPGPRTLAVKLREAARAQNLEQEVDKTAILEAYLNRLPYGHGLVGPEAAAQGYFGVTASQLSWAQAAFLAVLPRAPAYLDPYRHPQRVQLRQAALLKALHEAGHLDEAELRRALAEPVTPRRLSRPFLAPHLIVTLQAEDRLRKGPITRTTLDLKLQLDVEGLVHTQMVKMLERGASDAAVMVVDNATGDVLAYIGSTDFHDPAISGQIDMARAPRQPGSTLKPFVYALAFRHGRSGADMLADVPTTFPEGPGHVYAPRNFHGDVVGPVPAREALATSLNIPAVRLAAELEPDELLTTLRQVGLSSLTEPSEHYGLALALGSGEAGLRELAEAYVTLARGGEQIPLRYVLPTSFEAPPPKGTQVFDPSVAAAVTEALSDPLARARLVQTGRSPFEIGFALALKTGTSSGYRDAWTVGYTHERTVAVWVGNADGSPMHKVTGASGAGPLFADVMRRAMQDVPLREPLWPPERLVIAEVCPLSGQRPGPACPHAVQRRLDPQTLPTEACTLHVHAQPTTNGAGYTCAPEAKQTIAVFPKVFDDWLHTLPKGAPGKDPYGTPWLPRSQVPGCADAQPDRPALKLTAPTHGSVLWVDPTRGDDAIELKAELLGISVGQREAQGLDEIEFWVDGNKVATSPWPYRALVRLSPGDHEIVARPSDPGIAIELGSTQISVRG